MGARCVTQSTWRPCAEATSVSPTVAALSEDERVAEIVRMLGGEAASAAARRHARELLAGRRKGRSV